MIASPLPREARFEREDLLRIAEALPAAPRIFASVSALLADMNSSVEEITVLLKRDPALTARILRVSNSVAYRGQEPLASLEDALTRVGFGETYRIVGFATVAQAVARELSLYGVPAARFRENSLLTALVMERLAKLVGLDSRSAYTAGLLRSIGKVALDSMRVSAGSNYLEEGEGPLLGWETEMCGMDNAQAACLVLEHWRFPDEVVVAVREHYAPSDGAPRMANLLNVAAAAAERCGHGWPGEWPYWAQEAERRNALSLSETDVQDATREALQAFGPVRLAVG